MNSAASEIRGEVNIDTARKTRVEAKLESRGLDLTPYLPAGSTSLDDIITTVATDLPLGGLLVTMVEALGSPNKKQRELHTDLGRAVLRLSAAKGIATSSRWPQPALRGLGESTDRDQQSVRCCAAAPAGVAFTRLLSLVHRWHARSSAKLNPPL